MKHEGIRFGRRIGLFARVNLCYLYLGSLSYLAYISSLNQVWISDKQLT